VTIRSPAEARDPTAWMVADLPRTTNLNEARAFCRAVARRHYENFPVVSLLVPRRLRQDFANVYAFARWSDDLADESGDPSAASSRLSAWRRDLASCFRGEAEHPVFVALAETVGRTGLSIDPFSRLLDAFERDQRQTTYATREELLGYCGNSANPVGRIVLALEGCRDPDRLALSDAICTGLQLVNFWQDIRRTSFSFGAARWCDRLHRRCGPRSGASSMEGVRSPRRSGRADTTRSRAGRFSARSRRPSWRP
jgi:hypothetical protein